LFVAMGSLQISSDKEQVQTSGRRAHIYARRDLPAAARPEERAFVTVAAAAQRM